MIIDFLKNYQWVGAWLALVAWSGYITWLIRRDQNRARPIPAAPVVSTTQTRLSMDSQWAQWVRDSSDKYLVVFVWIVLLSYNLHILHHGSDSTQLQFVNGLINNLEGAFLTLVTGAVLRKSATATTEVTTAPHANGPIQAGAETTKKEAVTITDK